jgi:hypothetical protein
VRIQLASARRSAAPTDGLAALAAIVAGACRGAALVN